MPRRYVANLNATEIHARRLNAKNMKTPRNGENNIFPFADGTVKNCLEEIHGFEKSTSMRDQW